MALPGNSASSYPDAGAANYLAPYDRFTDYLTDYEAGGSDVGVSDDGLDYQVWRLEYDDDETSSSYGDFTVIAETTGQAYTPINVPDVARVALAWDQNMNYFLAYEKKDCGAFFYWYDTLTASYKTTELPSGSRYVAACLDDHRVTQSGTSDIIIAYIKGGYLCYRQQRDRYGVEYQIAEVGGAELRKVGMTEIGRLKFDVIEGRGRRLSDIVGDLCRFCELPASKVDLEDLYPTWVRGYIAAGNYSAADTIRKLQATYFFDMPEVDGQLLAVNRGGSVVAQITQDDMVVGEEASLQTAREQGIEFTRKFHLQFQSAETEYSPTKATSERISPLVKSVGEASFESAVNFERDEASQRADIMHKITWNEQEGNAKFSVSEEYAYLVPSDLISVEVRTGAYKRMRILNTTLVDGAIEIEAVIDRASAYSSGATAPPVQAADTPIQHYPGDTTFEFLDLPVLDGATDTLHYYAAGRGEAASWAGAVVYRLVGSDYEQDGVIPAATNIGTLADDLPEAPREFIDVTNTLLANLPSAPSSSSTALLLQGRGAWLVGDEIIQVRDWTAAGDDYAGTYLLRGRLNTPVTGHAAGERVVYLGGLARVDLDAALRDTLLTLKPVSIRQSIADVAGEFHEFTGKSQEEWAPHDLVAAQDGADWVLSWTPRHRLGNSAAPKPSSNFYGWRLKFTVGATTHTVTTSSTDPSYTFTEADQITYFGSAQSSFDTVEIMGMNHLGGEGESLSEAVS